MYFGNPPLVRHLYYARAHVGLIFYGKNAGRVAVELFESNCGTYTPARRVARYYLNRLAASQFGKRNNNIDRSSFVVLTCVHARQ